MDRFIDLDYTSSVKNQLNLKSNMDRFIVLKKFYLRKGKGFKIQYG